MRKGRRTGAFLTALVMLGSLMSGCAGKPTGSTPGNSGAENSAPDNSTPEEWLPGGLYEDPEFERQDADVVEADVVLPGGIPRLVIDGKQTEPILFSAASLSEVTNRQAGFAASNSAVVVRVGVDPFDGKEDICRQLDGFIDAYDQLIEGEYYLLISFGTTASALQFGADNFTENFTNQNGQTFPYNSIASDSWMEYASQLTETVVDAVLSSPKYAGKVVAYMPCGSFGGEWFGPNFWNGHYDKSDACTKKFREWLKKTYGSDEALQAAWGNSTVTLAKAAIPGNVPVYNSNDSDKSTVLLEPAQQNIADYQLFYSELMASRIAELCRVVKEKTGGRSLAGAYYGYQYEISIAVSGCLDLSTLLQNPDVDFLAAPNSYADRNEGGTGASMAPVSAVQAAGKLWLDESDYRSPIRTAGGDSAEVGLGDEGSIKSYENLIEIMKRQYGKNMVYNSGTWWLDLLSRGWYDSEAFWQESAKLQELYRQYASYKTQRTPEVCFVWDDRAMCLLGQAWAVTDDILRQVKLNAHRSGLSFGFYSMDDLLAGRIDGAKMYVMYTPWAISADDAAVLEEKLHRSGVTTVWMYGFGRTDPALFTRLTGMTVERLPTGSLDLTMGGGLPVAGLDARFCSGRQVTSRYAVQEDGVTVLGRYDAGGQAAAALVEKDGWKSVFYGNTLMKNDVLRALAAYAGATVRLDTQDVVYDDGSLLVVHASASGSKTLHFPGACDVYDYFTGTWHTGVSTVDVEMDSYTTRYFFYGKQADLQGCGIG